jgi:hypothetical protein
MKKENNKEMRGKKKGRETSLETAVCAMRRQLDRRKRRNSE